LIVAPTDVTGRYEKLRDAVLRAEFTSCPGLGILARPGQMPSGTVSVRFLR
jgi:hypothetical protein